MFNPIHRLNQDIFQACPLIVLRNLLLIAMSLNVTSSRQFTSELKKCDYTASCPVHTGFETSDPDHMSGKKMGQLGLHCECRLRSRAVLIWAFQNQEERPKRQSVRGTLKLKREASTSSFPMGKKHTEYLECASQPPADKESRAEYLRFDC